MSQFKIIVTLVTAMFATAAAADSFICDGVEESLRISLHNGESNSVMIVSDPSVQYGRKTIAKFSRDKGTLYGSHQVYTGQVDRRFSELSRAGENIGGTKLGQLRQIVLVISDSQNIDGDLFATVSLVKRDGDVLQHDLTCTLQERE